MNVVTVLRLTGIAMLAVIVATTLERIDRRVVMGRTLNEAYNKHMELLQELAEKDKEIAMLRNDSIVAREAIQRYCPLELFPSADKWLRERGL